MFLAGDEFGNSQRGNNNAYCQDNDISWLNWNDLDTHQDFFRFAKGMIAFRKQHPVLRGKTEPCRCGWPDISLHNGLAWNSACDENTRQIGVLFAGRTAGGEADDAVLLAVNAHWEAHWQELPCPPAGMRWRMHMNTACPQPFPSGCFPSGGVELAPRTAAVFVLEPVPESD